MDPQARKFAELSPYAAMMNNPVRYIDPDGEDPLTLIGIGVVLLYTYIQTAHANTPEDKNGDPTKWAWDPRQWYDDPEDPGVNFEVGANVNSSGDVTAYGGAGSDPSAIPIFGYSTEEGFGTGMYSTNSGTDLYHPSTEQALVENVDQGISNAREVYTDEWYATWDTPSDVNMVFSGEGNPETSFGWSFSRDITVTEIDDGHGYSEETGTIRFNGKKGSFVSQGSANGVEASFSIANLSVYRTTNNIRDIQNLKGETISFNLSVGMVGVSVFTDYHGPYRALGQQYTGVRLGLGYGFGFSTTISDMWELNEY